MQGIFNLQCYIYFSYGGDTLLKLNKDGNWEYAPSSKKAVVNYKYGSYNSPFSKNDFILKTFEKKLYPGMYFL